MNIAIKVIWIILNVKLKVMVVITTIQVVLMKCINEMCEEHQPFNKIYVELDSTLLVNSRIIDFKFIESTGGYIHDFIFKIVNDKDENFDIPFTIISNTNSYTIFIDLYNMI